MSSSLWQDVISFNYLSYRLVATSKVLTGREADLYFRHYLVPYYWKYPYGSLFWYREG